MNITLYGCPACIWRFWVSDNANDQVTFREPWSAQVEHDHDRPNCSGDMPVMTIKVAT